MIWLVLIFFAVSAFVSYRLFNRLAAYCKKQVAGFKPSPAKCEKCYIQVARKTNGMGESICNNC